MKHRPACPSCGLPVDCLRRSPGVFAAYPCTHWLTPGQASEVGNQARALRAATREA